MIQSVLAAFVAGFFAGNGLPYYIAGSTGEGVNPSPFRDAPAVNVGVGWVGVGLGFVAWQFVDPNTWWWASYGSAAFGVLVVGLIHARLWRNDPWRKQPR